MQTSRYVSRMITKILLVIVLAVLLFLGGLMIGYGIVGDGSVFKVFDPSLWTHILDFTK
jgi:DNA-directed RNA polymerase subunit beta.